MITPELVPDLERFSPCYRPRMMMLGAQECSIRGVCTAREWFARYLDSNAYDELDMADGDLRLDLNGDLGEIAACYGTVFDLGSIEHVWDVHRAYCNALRAVEIGGFFLCHSPVGGWQDAGGLFNHGLHLTRAEAIEDFIERNGFVLRDRWLGKVGQRGVVLWLAAQKERHIARIEDFRPIYRLRGRAARGFKA